MNRTRRLEVCFDRGDSLLVTIENHDDDAELGEHLTVRLTLEEARVLRDYLVRDMPQRAE